REQKVGDYYHELEQGRLPMEGVSGRVFDALGEILGTSAERLRAAGAAMRPPELGAHASFMRVASGEGPVEALEDADAALGAPAAGPEPGEGTDEGPDEVDELFTGG
ncbi:MAG TPA: hypothetical protein VKA36_05060, partial [Solirubrobacterales bacterium]|nr:hypothetical protein [Solirubrobacterales bacterium]